MSRDLKYIGMDVHKEAVVIAVLSSSGKLVMESMVETKASSIPQFIHGLRGELHVTWEEGTWAAWLYDLLKPHVHQVLVCDPRRNALLKEGNLDFLWQEGEGLQLQIESLIREREQMSSSDPSCVRLQPIPGVGPLVSTVVVSAIGNGAAFKKGRNFAAWLGTGAAAMVNRRQGQTAGHQCAAVRPIGILLLRQVGVEDSFAERHGRGLPNPIPDCRDSQRELHMSTVNLWGGSRSGIPSTHFGGKVSQ